MAPKGTWRDTPEWRPKRRARARQARGKTVLAFYALVALVLLTGGTLARQMIGYGVARDEYAAYQATETALTLTAPPVESPAEAAPPVENMPESAPVLTAQPTAKPFYSARVASLRKENRHAVAWLDIVNTEIQYPVVQGDDNAYYMTHTFKKKKNASGAIFMDSWNAPDFTDFNTVIYGHNMKDGSMFAGLREYRHQWFADKYSTIEITLLDKKLTYRVFAAYTAQSEEAADFRGQGCATEEQRSVFIKAARKRSTELDSSLTISRHDRLLTLVTCTSGTHPWYWVVHAVLVAEQTVAE